MPRYDFKFWQEAAWAAFMVAVVYVLGALSLGETPDDWWAWLGVVAIGAARAFAGALLSLIKKQMPPDEGTSS